MAKYLQLKGNLGHQLIKPICRNGVALPLQDMWRFQLPTKLHVRVSAQTETELLTFLISGQIPELPLAFASDSNQVTQ